MDCSYIDYIMRIYSILLIFYSLLLYFQVYAWHVPDNEDVAKEEADHLFAGSDDDHNDFLR